MTKSLTSRIVALVCLALFTLQSFGGTVTGVVQNAAGGPVRNGTFSFTLTAPATVAGTATVVTSSVPCYTDGNGNVAGEPDPLLAPTLTVNLASGTLAAATYFVKIWYFDGTGNSFVSPEASINLASPGTLNVLSPVKQPLNASGFRVGISTSSGTETLQGSVTGVPGAWGNFAQSSALVAGTAMPGSNTTVCTLRFNDELTPSFTCYDVGLTSSIGANIPGYPQYWYLAGGSAGTINVGSGTPQSNVCQGAGVVYPQAILTSPPFNATQTINGPLSLNGFPLTAGLISGGGLNISSAWRDCRKDGTLDPTNVLDAASTLNLCFLNAFLNGQEAFVPSGFYNISSANVNAANAFGVRVHGESSIVAFSGTNPVWGTVFMCNRGSSTACVEMEGSQYAEFDHITILQNGCIGSKCVTNPTGIGLVWGRDDSLTGLGGSTSAGHGGANNFCFQTGARLHDVTIANLGATSNTLNGNRGYVNFYNVGGTENAGMENVTFYGGTQVVLADRDVIAPTGTYYPLSTGCPNSMTEFTFLNTNFLSDNNLVNQLPNIESDNAQNIHIINGEFIGGNAGVLGKGTLAFNMWNITGAQESTATPSYFINLAAGAAPPRDFYVHVEGGPNTAFVNATTNGTTFVADKFIWNTDDLTHPPFTNTATGQVFQGGTLVSGATSISLSNVQMLGSDVYTPLAGRANVAFSSGSAYTLHGNDGITNFGTQFAQTIRQTDAGSNFIIQDAGGTSHFFIAPGGVNTFVSGNGTGRTFIGTNGHITGSDAGIFVIGDGIGGTGKSIVQEQSVSTGSIGATTRTEVLLTWSTTMGDTNYKVQCNVQDSTTAAGTQGLTFERIRTLSATQVGAVINNPTAGAITGTVYCTGTHP